MKNPACFSFLVICFLLFTLTPSLASMHLPVYAAFERSQVAQITKLIKKYGKPAAVDVIRQKRNGVVTLLYKDEIIENYREMPDFRFITAATLYHDMKAARLDISEFARLLRENTPHKNSSAQGDRQAAGKTLKQNNPDKRLEFLYRQAKSDRKSRNQDQDQWIQRKLDSLQDVNAKLLLAAREAYYKGVVRAIEAGANVNCKDSRGFTPLMRVVKFGKVTDDCGIGNQSSAQDPLKVMAFLIKRGAQMAVVSANGETALDMAVIRGRVDMAELLAAHGASLSKQTKNINLLIEDNQKEMLRYLAQSGVDLDANSNGTPPLIWALAQPGTTRGKEFSRLLLDLGANPCTRNRYHQTALQFAIRQPDMDVFKTILNHCAKETINCRSNRLETVLDLAMYFPKPKRIKMLLSAGANVSARNTSGRTPLLTLADQKVRADIRNYIESAELLLDAGANVNETDYSGNTPLILAAEHGNPDLIDFLISKGANLYHANYIGQTAAYILAGNGYTDALTVFRKHAGAKALAPDTTPLLVEALSRNHPDTAMMLIDCGARINQRDRGGDTPLMIAAGRPGAYKVLKRLIQLGAAMDAQNSSGLTALMTSIYRETIDATNLLLEHGADISLNASNGQSALHVAAKLGAREALKKLIENHAELNLQDTSGDTPLMVAQNLTIAELLVRAGARTDIRDWDGNTALDKAKKFHKEKIARYLEEKR